ncbi:catalase family peroxidase [Pseudidiomarina mangrovi]|uniref:catalase family peroxidase n=1 Tax=Pseudidiomarina mangrovi TaxID=2487133 RepID=UPI0013DFD7F2|nr:catalase family peroxidase [Pseudidiomarina mangrovi]
MFKVSLLTAVVTTVLATMSPVSVAQQAPASANASDFIAVFKELFGTQPGVRKGHAKGVCAVGEFSPTAAAQQQFNSPLFGTTSVPLVLRFSMGGGNPEADERSNSPRGIGVQFQLPNNQVHMLAGLSTPMFAGKNPQQFLGLLQLNAKRARGEATGDDLQAYFAANPEVARQGNFLANNPPAAEYTQSDYFGVHTFLATTADGQSQPFRWQLQPQRGTVALTKEQQQQLPPSFLADRLAARLAADGQVSFDWYWQLPEAGDVLDDPSQPWPAERSRIKVGEITVTASHDEACQQVNFDPNRLANGIAPSNDPVLAIRSAAYAISWAQRLSGQ